MSKKKLSIIAVFFVAHVMLCNSTYSDAKTIDELKAEIKKSLCPNGKVKMKKILKNSSTFRWMKPRETVLVFPAQQNFPNSDFQAMMEPEAKDYARDSLRLIPPIARTNNFLKLYYEAILIVKAKQVPQKDKIDVNVVVDAFRLFEGCCLPLDIGRTEIPTTYSGPDGLASLISDPNKCEKPPDGDLLP